MRSDRGEAARTMHARQHDSSACSRLKSDASEAGFPCTFYLMIRDQADPPTFGCGRLHLLFCVPCPLCASFFEALAVAAVVFLRDLVPTL